MSRAPILAGAAIIAAMCLGSAPAAAQDDGLATMHEWVRVGAKTCMRTHFHYGSSSGQRTKELAEREAVGAWASFTAWEYGDHWGRWRLAESRSVKCGQETSGWACNVEARPCRMTARPRRR